MSETNVVKKKKPTFLRRVWNRHSKLGAGRKKIQRWKRPTGRHNKMRWKRRGYPAVVSIGYKEDDKIRGQINAKETIVINNLKDLENLDKNYMIILGKVGMKKKIEIVNKAKEMKIEIYQTNPEKFLAKNKLKSKENKKWI